ncbi:unnamed protein product [Euphydryas editha]|uniref:Uncharacterized protein n=1 Tax=Euphydryas editha TaxID=104508 RepID=A0AAU9T8T4_EUPED|nr:unnamed protein product [Euphydryas editha]
MSVKTSKVEKKKPRAMPVETIITRFKSAQQKQLLENQSKSTKQKNIKSKNKQSNLKSPEQKSIRQKKVHQKSIKKPENTIITKNKINDIKVENKEYYPNKLKRKVLNAKVFLAPKHSFKVICGMKSFNKRKLRVPQRDADYMKEETTQPYQETNKTKQNQSELSIVEMVRIIEENCNLDDEDLLEILTCPSPVWWEETPDGYIEEPLFSQQQFVDNQMNNNVLENEQMNDSESNNNNMDIIKPDSFDVIINNKDKSFINKRCKLEVLLGNIKNKAKPIIKDDMYRNESENKGRNKEEIKNEKCMIKSNTECIEEDFLEFCDDDDILKHLENIDIPTEMSIIRDDFDIEESKSRRTSTESCKSVEDMSEEYLDLSLLDDEYIQNEIQDDIKGDEMIENLTSNDKDNTQIDLKDSQNEYVTVYKILKSETSEKIDKKDGKINSYYKCKKTSNSSKSFDQKIDKSNEVVLKDTELNDYENKSIVISDTDNVKYCFICSSIFDTEKCNYCLRKALKRKLS